MGYVKLNRNLLRWEWFDNDIALLVLILALKTPRKLKRAFIPMALVYIGQMLIQRIQPSIGCLNQPMAVVSTLRMPLLIIMCIQQTA